MKFFLKKYKVHKLCKVIQNGDQIEHFLNTCQFLSNYSKHFVWKKCWAGTSLRFFPSPTLSSTYPPLLSFLSFSSLTILSLSYSPYCFLFVIPYTFIYIYFFFSKYLFFLCVFLIWIIVEICPLNFQFRGMGFDPSCPCTKSLALTIEPLKLLRN